MASQFDHLEFKQVDQLVYIIPSWLVVLPTLEYPNRLNADIKSKRKTKSSYTYIQNFYKMCFSRQCSLSRGVTPPQLIAASTAMPRLHYKQYNLENPRPRSWTSFSVRIDINQKRSLPNWRRRGKITALAVNYQSGGNCHLLLGLNAGYLMAWMNGNGEFEINFSRYGLIVEGMVWL